jgi:uridine kinase
MLHDAPNMNEVRFVRAAEAIFDRYKDEFYEMIRCTERIVIAVAGGPGTGKTSIACILCRLINEDHRCDPAMVAKHLAADDFYLANYRGEMPGFRESTRGEAHYGDVGPSEYNWYRRISPYDSLSDVISTYRGDSEIRACTIPCVDVLNQQIDGLTIDFNQTIGKPIMDISGPVRKIGPINILVIEGLYAIDARMEADFRFFILGDYFQEKAWQALRPLEFDREEFAERVAKSDGVNRIQQYAKDVMQRTEAVQQQDIRCKERLTEERIVTLELELQATRQLRRNIEQQIAAGKPIRFTTLLPMADKAVIEPAASIERSSSPSSDAMTGRI